MGEPYRRPSGACERQIFGRRTSARKGPPAWRLRRRTRPGNSDHLEYWSFSLNSHSGEKDRPVRTPSTWSLCTRRGPAWRDFQPCSSHSRLWLTK